MIYRFPCFPPFPLTLSVTAPSLIDIFKRRLLSYSKPHVMSTVTGPLALASSVTYWHTLASPFLIISLFFIHSPSPSLTYPCFLPLHPPPLGPFFFLTVAFGPPPPLRLLPLPSLLSIIFGVKCKVVNGIFTTKYWWNYLWRPRNVSCDSKTVEMKIKYLPINANLR